MGRTLFAFIALLLLFAVQLPAAAEEASLPEWKSGDRWSYSLTTRSPEGVYRGNVTLEVRAVGHFRPVNGTSTAAYTVSMRRTLTGFGFNVTVEATLVFEKSTLCLLHSNATQATTHGFLRSETRTEETYSPSDGRYGFPLVAGVNWTSSYGLTRTVFGSSGSRNSNETLARSYGCTAREAIGVPAGRYLAWKVNCFTDDTGNYTRYWYAREIRSDALVEEYDRVTDSRTILELKSYHREPENTIFRGPDAQNAFILAVASVILLCLTALGLVYRSRPPKPPEPEQTPGQGSLAFQFVRTRDGYSMKVNTTEIGCPACRKRFKVVVTSTRVKCPHCGKEGTRG